MMELLDYPARCTLAGVRLNVFQSPAGKGKDGSAYGGDYRLQLMSADHLRNGETKLTPTEVSVGEDAKIAESYKGQMGKVVHLPVSVYVSQNVLRVNLAAEKAAAHA